jgi:exopolyphosphatase/guanosine-5'-triphosphate,3'-diphosphate pyrophosphatase
MAQDWEAAGNAAPQPAGRKHDRARPLQGRAVADGPVYGALDLGTNNCRLLVAKPWGNGFRVVDAFSRIVRLGEGVATSGRLSEAAVERAIAALKVCAQKMRNRGVTHTRNVATEACRQAVNGPEFIARVERETGIRLDIIPPVEEARLAVMGCQALLDPAARRAIVFDIGGGSTELTWLALQNGKPRIMGWMSIPFGVVNLTETYDTSGILSPDGYERLKSFIVNKLKPFDRRFNLSPAVAKGGVQLLGTSGTVTTLTSLNLGLPRYDRSRVDGAWVDRQDMVSLCRRLPLLERDERAELSSIGADRAELIVAGCAILDAIMELWPVPRLRVADRGIREGLLLELMGAVNTPLGKRPPNKSNHSGRHNRRRRRRRNASQPATAEA